MKIDVIKKYIKKVRLIYLAVPLSIGIITFFILWQYDSGNLKKIKLNEEVTTEQLSSTYLEEKIVGNNKDVITCAIEKKNIEDKEYFNYVIGKGVGKKVNFSILIKIDEDYYKIKTLESNRDKKKVYLTGYVYTKKLPEKYEVFLYNKDSNIIYFYKGEENEREI